MTLQLASDEYPQWINDIEVVDIQFGILAMPSVVFMSCDFVCFTFAVQAEPPRKKISLAEHQPKSRP